MKVVKERDKVQILYEAKLEDGTLCYKNEKGNPLEFVVGEGTIFPAIETVLKDMKQGETKTVTLEPEEAFGPYLDGLVIELPKDNLQSDTTLDIGSKIKAKTSSGKTVKGTIIELKDEMYTIDLNHPLAGRKIVFTVTVVSVVK